ncbi:hypothetical protein P170DRAFT_437844 [Aspergillus steynii IBT 23096]|uniref:N-acetyltransferase domain-containing protein n=1 Tax=Aspergillus steynii IBT 23096 TaxID=1392250 RepID=A0A2I2G5I8_9EURO|nr:uncharacterized protein P170DRAFT_437844 [Aspergillus steynii IBT 23096]PLB48141.1 hypothetical protein P170DRAFT_437844 [Aspergillus steynii IBT 23096]
MAPPPRPTPPYTIQTYTSSQLSQHPALVAELTDLINESFGVYASHPLGRTGLRMERPGQLIEELGPSGLTAIYFHHAVDAEEHPTKAAQLPGQVIGTASIKAWAGDAIWNPVRTLPGAGLEPKDDKLVSVDGDFELGIVAVKPIAEFRGKGIADKLVEACEQAILPKWALREDIRPSLPAQAQAQAGSSTPRNVAKISPPSPVKIMVKVVKEITALYWERKGFVTVGERLYPPGTSSWGVEKEFTMSAMVRELPVAV